VGVGEENISQQHEKDKKANMNLGLLLLFLGRRGSLEDHAFVSQEAAGGAREGSASKRVKGKRQAKLAPETSRSSWS
jgi:hypothetical protein